jgi:hypothetical protein
VSPKQALGFGLKVDMDAVPSEVATAIKAGAVDLDDPANTLLLLQANAVVSVTGFFAPDGKSLRSVGIQYALLLRGRRCLHAGHRPSPGRLAQS